MEDPPPAPRIGYALQSYRLSGPLPSQRKPRSLPDKLLSCCGWGCAFLVLLPFVAWGLAVWLGPWIYDRLNPPFVPPAHAQQCGNIDNRNYHHPAGDNFNSAKQCFWLAYQTCHTAVLTVGFFGVDAFVIHNFVLEKQSARCSLSDYAQANPDDRLLYLIGVKGKTVSYVGLYQCKGLEWVGKGLRFEACGRFGNVNVDTGLNNLILPASGMT